MSHQDIDGRMHLHKTHEQDSHEDEQPGDLTLRERPLNLAAVRAKLQSKSGKQYWRTIEELAEDPHFEDLLHREFPRQASEWDEAVDRRDFLDRKSTRLNSSHTVISYAVFCLKKKKKMNSSKLRLH